MAKPPNSKELIKDFKPKKEVGQLIKSPNLPDEQNETMEKILEEDAYVYEYFHESNKK